MTRCITVEQHTLELVGRVRLKQGQPNAMSERADGVGVERDAVRNLWMGLLRREGQGFKTEAAAKSKAATTLTHRNKGLAKRRMRDGRNVHSKSFWRKCKRLAGDGGARDFFHAPVLLCSDGTRERIVRILQGHIGGYDSVVVASVACVDSRMCCSRVNYAGLVVADNRRGIPSLGQVYRDTIESIAAMF
jgi:hypothetical protein